MSRQLSNKPALCQLKGYLKNKDKMLAKPRHRSEPVYCKYASEGTSKHDPDCLIVRRPIADLETCPLTTRQTGRAEDWGIKPETESLLEGAMWTKTKN